MFSSSNFHRNAFVLAVVGIFLAGASIADEVRYPTFVHRAMATEFEIRFAVDSGVDQTLDFRQLAEEGFGIVDDLERRISSWIPDSQTSQVNNRAHKSPVKVSPDVFALFQESKRIHTLTGGLFDPTIGPVLDLWKREQKTGSEASPAALEATLLRVGMQHVLLNEDDLTVSFARPGMRIDWGAIGKGYALDLVAEHFRARGVQNALLSGGTSTIVAMGTPPGEVGWDVFLDEANAGRLFRHSGVPRVALRDQAISTSEVRRDPADASSPIINPRDGATWSPVLSAAVISPSATEADALSTALLIMSPADRRSFEQTVSPRRIPWMHVARGYHGPVVYYRNWTKNIRANARRTP